MADSDNNIVNASLDDGPDDLDVEEKSGGGLKKILLILIPLLIIGGAAGAYFTGIINFGGEKTEMADSKEEKEIQSASFLKIPDMIVNLSSDDGQPRYLRLSVQLELESDGDKAKIEAAMPRVIDQFQTYLRELRVRDLRGSAGIYRLQMELLSRVNAAAYPVEVQDVLFQEILIQ
ncbi:MAG: flagellar basal body-associated FliL family protein [Pseudomonadota bacterium]